MEIKKVFLSRGQTLSKRNLALEEQWNRATVPVYTAEDPSMILKKTKPHLFCVLVGITIQLLKE